MSAQPAIARLLPSTFADALVQVAAQGDLEQIDDLTDELAIKHPELVRPRHDTSRFQSMADQRRGGAG